jgi:hypothetical protein
LAAYLDNTANKIDTRDKVTAIPYQTDWQGVKRAQSIIKSNLSDCTKEECEILIDRLLKSVVKSSLENQSHINMAVRTVIDWHYEVSLQSLYPLRSRLKVYDFANKLLPWQEELFYRITALPSVIKVIIFEDRGLYYFWVVSNEPTTEMMIKFSEQYTNMLRIYSDLNVDFMVFGEEEISYYQVPDDAFIFINME